MQHPLSPTVRRRRLAAELRRLRESRSLKLSTAAKQANVPQSTLSNLETAEARRIKSRDLDSLTDLYQAPEEVRAALHELARESKERGWWAKYKDVFKNEALPDFEAEASNLRAYETHVVPGLLQTPDYARAIFHGGRYTSDEEINRRVEARMARREILTRFSQVRLRAVIDECALRRIIGGHEVMADQLKHLLQMAQMPHIDIQILPLDVGAHASLSMPFMILDFPNPLDPTIVCVETLTGALYLELPEEIERYNVTFGDIQGSAVNASRSAKMIRETLNSLESHR